MFNPTNAPMRPVLRPHLGDDRPLPTSTAARLGRRDRNGHTTRRHVPGQRHPTTASSGDGHPKRLEIKPNAFDDNGMLFVLNETNRPVAGTNRPNRWCCVPTWATASTWC